MNQGPLDYAVSYMLWGQINAKGADRAYYELADGTSPRPIRAGPSRKPCR